MAVESGFEADAATLGDGLSRLADDKIGRLRPLAEPSSTKEQLQP